MDDSQRRGAILAELQGIAAELGKMPRLYERRDELFRAARSLTPPVPVRELAEMFGIGVSAVSQVTNTRKMQQP